MDKINRPDRTNRTDRIKRRRGEKIKFSVVIPTLDNFEGLQKCVDSVVKAGKEMVEEIIVVDNSNVVNDEELIVKSLVKSEKLRIIQNERNEGFAKAVNQGVNIARNNWVAVLNDDVTINEGWFREIVNSVTSYGLRVGSICGTILNRDGTRIESRGLEFEIKGKARNRDNRKSYAGARFFANAQNDSLQYVFGASGAAVVYNKEAFVEVGMFDEDFFAYLEDVDLSLRLNSLGWKTLYEPGAICYHTGGGTADKMGGFRYRMTARNWWFIILKHYRLRTFVKNFPAIIVEQFKNFWAIKSVRGWLWLIEEVITQLPRMLKKRKTIL